MTRKHFIAIAKMLRTVRNNAQSKQEMETIARIARNLAYEFSRSNGAFQYHTFYTACGLDANGYADWVAVTSDTTTGA